MAATRLEATSDGQLVRLMEQNNQQLKAIAEILKQDHEIIQRIDENIRKIRFNTQ